LKNEFNISKNSTLALKIKTLINVPIDSYMLKNTSFMTTTKIIKFVFNFEEDLTKITKKES